MICEIIFSQQPFSILYSTKHGLPSNEVYVAYQDRQGFIWVGTDRGVSRFDGYSFKNFAIEDGLNKLEINIIKEDNEGQLWFSSYFGEVFYKEKEVFVPYTYNHLLKEYVKQGLLTLTKIDKKGTFYFNNQFDGTLSIDAKGNQKMIKPKCNTCYYLIEEGNNIYSGRYHLSKQKNKIPLLFTKNGKEKKLDMLKSGSKNESIRIGNTIIVALENKIYEILNGIIINSKNLGDRAVNNLIYISGDLFVSTSKGIDVYRDFIKKGLNGNKESWFQDQIISAVFADKDKGLWISSASHGLIYIPNPGIPVFLKNINIYDIASMNNDLLTISKYGIM
ncbi:MAG: hypothetical protein RLZZ546_588, partial [Bacteroidota bacterium]